MPQPPRREWREFEKLVARIESTLAPLGAVVRSPDNAVLDKDTQRPRNIDATVRYQSAKGPVFMALECRRRGRRQTVEWIEQLVGKKASIGATRMIGVSSAGFARNAMKKAARLGIELRSARSLDEEAVRRWIAMDSILLETVRPWVKGIELECPVELIERFAGATLVPTAAPVVMVAGESSPITLGELLERARGASPWPELEPGQIGSLSLPVTFAAEMLLRTSFGDRTFRIRRIDCGVKREVARGPRVAAVSYADGSSPILEAVHFDMSASIPGMHMAFHRHAETGGTSVHLIREPSAR